MVLRRITLLQWHYIVSAFHILTVIVWFVFPHNTDGMVSGMATVFLVFPSLGLNLLFVLIHARVGDLTNTSRITKSLMLLLIAITVFLSFYILYVHGEQL